MFSSQDDLHAACIAMAPALRALTEKLDVNPDRIRQFVESACEDDRSLIARNGMSMMGHINSEGDRN